MLEFLKRREVEKTKAANNYQFDKLHCELLSLGVQLENAPTREVVFDYKDSVLKIRGIPEDFRVFLNDTLVCECVYDNIYVTNQKLMEKLR